MSKEENDSSKSTKKTKNKIIVSEPASEGISKWIYFTTALLLMLIIMLIVNNASSILDNYIVTFLVLSTPLFFILADKIISAKYFSGVFGALCVFMIFKSYQWIKELYPGYHNTCFFLIYHFINVIYVFLTALLLLLIFYKSKTFKKIILLIYFISITAGAWYLYNLDLPSSNWANNISISYKEERQKEENYNNEIISLSYWHYYNHIKSLANTSLNTTEYFKEMYMRLWINITDFKETKLKLDGLITLYDSLHTLRLEHVVLSEQVKSLPSFGESYGYKYPLDYKKYEDDIDREIQLFKDIDVILYSLLPSTTRNNFFEKLIGKQEGEKRELGEVIKSIQEEHPNPKLFFLDSFSKIKHIQDDL